MSVAVKKYVPPAVKFRRYWTMPPTDVVATRREAQIADETRASPRSEAAFRAGRQPPDFAPLNPGYAASIRSNS